MILTMLFAGIKSGALVTMFPASYALVSSRVNVHMYTSL
jgi:hypothetical protein